jgi:hypothetical protein
VITTASSEAGAAKPTATTVELYLLGGRRLTFTMKRWGLELFRPLTHTRGTVALVTPR